MSAKTISASKLRDNFSEEMKSLKKDDVLIVTRRGKGEKAVITLELLKKLLDEDQKRQIEQAPANDLDEWTGDFIEKYRPALENLAKR